MGQKGMDFKHKEVINITDGKRLGFVQDVCADLETGSITSIISDSIELYNCSLSFWLLFLKFSNSASTLLYLSVISSNSSFI